MARLSFFPAPSFSLICLPLLSKTNKEETRREHGWVNPFALAASCFGCCSRLVSFALDGSAADGQAAFRSSWRCCLLLINPA